MLKTTGQSTSAQTSDRATDTKSRDVSRQPKRQAQDIHPSLRALPDYPE